MRRLLGAMRHEGEDPERAAMIAITSLDAALSPAALYALTMKYFVPTAFGSV